MKMKRTTNKSLSARREWTSPTGNAITDAERFSATLPLVRAIIRTIMSAQEELAKASNRAADYSERIDQLGGRIDREAFMSEIQGDIRELEANLTSQGQEIADLGGCVTDTTTGSVDFPSVLEGEAINLCWHLDDQCICFYHGGDEACGNRRPLPLTPAQTC
jgi:hypothetical protein